MTWWAGRTVDGKAACIEQYMWTFSKLKGDMEALVVTIIPIRDKRAWLNIEVLISRIHGEAAKGLGPKNWNI